MKTLFLSLCFALLASVIFAQTKNRISISYASANNGVDIKEGWIGDMGYTGKSGSLLEVKFSRNINSFFAVETGLQYAHNKIETHYFPDGIMHYKNSEINLVSVPVYGNLTFLKYFFAEAGPTFDFEFNHADSSSPQNQSGIGLGFGAGGKYSFNHVSIIINPFFQRQRMVTFNGDDYVEHLWQTGIKFGLGYSF